MMIKGISRVIALLVFSLVAAMAEAGEGVIEINQALALEGGVTPSDAPGFPVTLDTPGSYALSGNLTVSSDVGAVEITANNVALDLAGFSVRGSAGGTEVHGIAVNFNPVGRSQVEVRNGIIEGFSGYAVFLGDRARVLNIRVRNSAGMRLGGAGLFSGNTMISNEDGVFVGIATRVEDNIIEGAGNGIVMASQAGRDLVIEGNIVRFSGNAIVARDSVIRNNSVDTASISCISGNGNLIVDNFLRGCGTGIFAAFGNNTLRANVIYGNPPLSSSGSPNIFLGPNQCGSTTCQ